MKINCSLYHSVYDLTVSACWFDMGCKVEQRILVKLLGDLKGESEQTIWLISDAAQKQIIGDFNKRWNYAN